MTRIPKAYAAALAAMFGAGAVQAQQPIEPIAHPANATGTVLIGCDGEYLPLQPGSAPALSTGCSIITLEDSSVEVVYEDGCSVTLPGNSLLTVQTADECSRGLAYVQSAPAVALPALETTAGPSAGESDEEPAILPILGAMTVFSGFAVLVHETGDDRPPPVLSPE